MFVHADFFLENRYMYLVHMYKMYLPSVYEHTQCYNFRLDDRECIGIQIDNMSQISRYKMHLILPNGLN